MVDQLPDAGLCCCCFLVFFGLWTPAELPLGLPLKEEDGSRSEFFGEGGVNAGKWWGDGPDA